MDSSNITAEGTTIEVTIQSLNGVQINPSIDFSNITAMVTFTGSCSNMQVGSSTLCAKTGQLLIESAPLAVDTSGPISIATAQWPEELYSPSRRPPHLTVQVPHRDPNLPRAPLAKSNRGSKIVQKVLESPSAIRTPQHERTTSNTALWSEDEEVLPEIVELTVRVHDEQGMAYLVLFGHDNDHGTYIMDLPVRPLQTVDLLRQARLRVHVKVFREHRDAMPRLASTTSFSSSEEGVTQSAMQKSMASLKRSCEQQQGDVNQMVDEDSEESGIEIRVGRYEESADCMWNWSKFVRALEQVVQCNGVTPAGLAVDGGASVGSSIATPESLLD